MGCIDLRGCYCFMFVITVYIGGLLFGGLRVVLYLGGYLLVFFFGFWALVVGLDCCLYLVCRFWFVGLNLVMRFVTCLNCFR